MPADFELIAGTRTVYSRGWGALTDADLLGHMARISALFKAGTLDTEWAQLWDFTGVENVDGVSTAGIRRAAEGNPWPRSAIRACIVTTDEQFGLVRMYQALGDPKTDDMRITRSVADADAFIARERLRLGIGI
jgi:hypothetical protein